MPFSFSNFFMSATEVVPEVTAIVLPFKSFIELMPLFFQTAAETWMPK